MNAKQKILIVDDRKENLVALRQVFREVEAETARALGEVQKHAKLRGFRPGKAPATIIRKEFSGDIRKQVMESLIPKYLQKQFEAENLNVVGTPDIEDVHFHEGEPLRFTAKALKNATDSVKPINPSLSINTTLSASPSKHIAISRLLSFKY